MAKQGKAVALIFISNMILLMCIFTACNSNFRLQKEYEQLITKLESTTKECKRLKSENEDLMQQISYFEDEKPKRTELLDFYITGLRYEIDTPEKVYKDYACTEEFEEPPILVSPVVAELILNEEQTTYVARSKNGLVFSKTEIKIEEQP